MQNGTCSVARAAIVNLAHSAVTFSGSRWPLLLDNLCLRSWRGLGGLILHQPDPHSQPSSRVKGRGGGGGRRVKEFFCSLSSSKGRKVQTGESSQQQIEMGLSSSALIQQLDPCLGCSPGNLSCSLLIWGVADSLTDCFVIQERRHCFSRALNGLDREVGVRKEIFHTIFISLDVEFISWCISMCMFRNVSGISAREGAAAGPAGMVGGQGRDVPGASWICEGSGTVELKRNTKCEIGGWDVSAHQWLLKITTTLWV